MTSKCGKTDKQVANKATGECVIAQQHRIYLFYSIKKKKTMEMNYASVHIGGTNQSKC